MFNVQQLMDTFLGYPAVTAVNYDPLDNPTRMVSRSPTDLNMRLQLPAVDRCGHGGQQ